MSNLIPECHPERPHLAKGLCKPCYNKTYYQENKEQYAESGRQWRSKPENKIKLRDKNLKYYFGISLEDFNQRVKNQSYVCAICKQAEPTHVDHCHKTGKIRAILCHPCNTAIGLFKENLTTIDNAKRYLIIYGN